MHAKINNDANELKSSNFDQLEHFIHDTLDSGESLRLKLESPLSVGAVLAKYVRRWGMQQVCCSLRVACGVVVKAAVKANVMCLTGVHSENSLAVELLQILGAARFGAS